MSDTISYSSFIPPDPSHLADLFPGYEIVRLIACGGMGAVYEAMQIALDRTVAIKILPREFTNDESFRTGFQAEAKAMARLNHPNLISVYDFGEADGMLYIIMEYVPGFSLFQAADGKPILQKEAVPLVAAICRGLAHAHEGGIIHRDIKPANILLNHHNEPKIGDFGLARPLEHQLQEGEEIYGTPGYTAPEVLETPQSIDHRADIFSLGVLLHELLTGLLPGADPRTASVICHCDPRFDGVIRKATNPSPGERHNTAIELATEIEKISTTAGPRVLQTTAASRRAPRIAKPTYQTQKHYSLPKKSNSKGGLIVVLVVAVCLATYFFLKALDGSKETGKTTSAPVEVQPIVTPTLPPPPPRRPLRPTPPPPEPEEPVEIPATIPASGLVEWGGALHDFDDSFGGILYSVRSGDINGKTDSGIFQYETWEGDGVFTLEISPITDAPSDAKAGLMIRESLESHARNVLLARNSNGETILQLRILEELDTIESNRITAGHRILRVHRIGEQLNADASRDGDVWVEIGSIQIPGLAEQIFVGFAAASATQPTAEPINGRFQPIQSEKFDLTVSAADEPAPNADIDLLFQRARDVMKERALPLQAEFQQQLKANTENYLQLSQELINRLPENERIRFNEHQSENLKTIEASGYIGARPMSELTEIPNYLALHQTSLERQKSIQQIHAAKMLELQEIYINGINNQIQRSSMENDIGTTRVLEAEKEQIMNRPYYFRILMESNG
jgi:serine/threonine protein kinase